MNLEFYCGLSAQVGAPAADSICRFCPGTHRQYATMRLALQWRDDSMREGIVATQRALSLRLRRRAVETFEALNVRLQG